MQSIYVNHTGFTDVNIIFRINTIITAETTTNLDWKINLISAETI